MTENNIKKEVEKVTFTHKINDKKTQEVTVEKGSGKYKTLLNSPSWKIKQ